VWSSTDDIAQNWALDAEFSPASEREAADVPPRRWLEAVERSRGWAASV
jgi:glycerol kinase